MKINDLNDEIENLKNKDFNELLDYLYTVLEIDNNKYKTKMIGYIIPFHAEKRFRIERNEFKKYKPDVKGNEQLKSIIDCNLI